jgi:hypothetical protein
MARRHGETESPISLFSFQDIITSVTAIMILLVLILSLELIARGSAVGVAADDRRVANEAVKSVEQLRERLVALLAETADAREAAKRTARQSTKDIEADRRAAQRQSEILASAIATLESDLKKAGIARQSAEQDLLIAEREGSTTEHLRKKCESGEAAAALEKKNEEEERRQQEAERELSDSPRLVSRLVFNPPKGQALRPILVEISADGIAVLGGDDPGIIEFGWGVLGPPGSFLKWLGARNKEQEYVVIMLRPSGFEKLEAIRSLVIANGLEVGMELVGEGTDIVVAAEATGPS